MEDLNQQIGRLIKDEVSSSKRFDAMSDIEKPFVYAHKKLTDLFYNFVLTKNAFRQAAPASLLPATAKPINLSSIVNKGMSYQVSREELVQYVADLKDSQTLEIMHFLSSFLVAEDIISDLPKEPRRHENGKPRVDKQGTPQNVYL